MSIRSRDSQETFSLSVKNVICGTYGRRCVICLTHTPTIQCASIVDSDATRIGENQRRIATELGILSPDYQQNSAGNGLPQCPTCHDYFTRKILAFSLPIPVLEYVRDYLQSTPKANRKPLHEVFDLLVDSSRGEKVELPDAKAIFPYLGLFTLVTLTPGVIGDPIPTLFEPPLSIIRGKEFAKARSNASPTGKNVARIFAPLALVDDSPWNLGAIPISPDDQTFHEKRYWRLPVPSAHVFATLTGRLWDDLSDCLDIRLARIIHSILTLQCFDKPLPYEIHGNGGPSSDGGGGSPRPNDDNMGGRGPVGGRTPSKRKRAVKSGASPSKRTKKVRTTSGGSESRAFDESGEFPFVGQYQNQQSDHFQIASSTYIPEDDVSAHLISSVRDDNSDFEIGLSVSATIPHDKDNPAIWRFGPSFSTNKIVFTARGINLT